MKAKRMLKKFLSYIAAMQESRMTADDMFRKKSSSKGDIELTDGEFFSCFDFNDGALRGLKDAYAERDFEAASEELLRYFKNKNFFGVFELQEGAFQKRFSELFPGAVRNIVERAESVCRKQFSMPTGFAAEFSDSINWSDNFIGGSWPYLKPKDFLRRIFEHGIVTEENLRNLLASMEMNKHHAFVDLAKAFVMTGNEKYAQEFILDIEEWIDKNPVNSGIAWFDPLAVSQRVISWIFALSVFIESSKFIKSDCLLTIMKSLLLHGTYLYAALSSKTQLVSRSIACASALYMLSSFFPEFETSEKWKHDSNRKLENVYSVFFLDDGVCRYRSIGLQILFTEFYMIPFICCRFTGDMPSPAIRSVVERSLEFMMYTMAPRRVEPKRSVRELPFAFAGQPVNFGDAAATRVWYFSSCSQEDFRNLLCMGACLFNRGDMKYAAGNSFYEDSMWFFRLQGEDAFNDIVSNPPQYMGKAFVKGGYFSFRDTWGRDSVFWMFYGNSKNPVPFLEDDVNFYEPHKDIMNFVLYIKGEPVIIESGSYKGPSDEVPPDINSYMCDYRAHNTILVNRNGYSIQKSIKSSRKYTRFLKTKWRTSDEMDYVCAVNPGFPKEASGVTHRREAVCLKKRKWFVIADTLEGKGEFSVSHIFNLAPAVSLTQRRDNGCFIYLKRDNIRMNMIYPGEFSCKYGKKTGVYSPLSGEIKKCDSLTYNAKIQLPCTVYTWFSWANGDLKHPDAWELEELFEKIRDSKGMMEDEIQFETES